MNASIQTIIWNSIATRLGKADKRIRATVEQAHANTFRNKRIPIEENLKIAEKKQVPFDTARNVLWKRAISIIGSLAFKDCAIPYGPAWADE